MNYFVIALLLVAVAQVAHSSSQYPKSESANSLNNANSDEDGVDPGQFFGQNGGTDPNSDEIDPQQPQKQQQQGQGQVRPSLGIFWGHTKGKKHYRDNYQGMSDSQQSAQEGQQNQGQDMNSDAQSWQRQEQQFWERQRQQQPPQQQDQHQQWSYQQQPYQQKPYQQQPYQQQPYQQQPYQQQPYQQQPYQQQPYQQKPNQKQPYQHQQQQQHGYNYDPSFNVDGARGVYDDASQYLNQHKMDGQNYLDLAHNKFLEQQQQMFGIGGKHRVFHPDEQQNGQGGRFVSNQQRHRGTPQDSDENDSVEIKNSVRGSYQSYL